MSIINYHIFIFEYLRKMNDEFNIFLKNLKETKILAKKISKFVAKRTFICLKGELGIGKTTFANFLINELSEKKINVLSPTYSILQIYELKKIKIWHYDLYRVKNKNEIFFLDFENALNDCVLVEWPEIINDYCPENRIELEFYEKKNLEKNVKIFFYGKKYNKLKF